MRFFLVLAAFTLVSVGCQDTKEYEAQIGNLQNEIKAMQTQMLELQAEKDAEAESKTSFDATGIAIVDMEKLLAEYKGYTDAEKKYERIVKGYASQLEKMKNDFRVKYQTTADELQVYGEDYIAQAKVELEQMEKDIYAKEQELTQKTSELNTNMLKGVLKKVNAHSKGYAEKNGYQMILFTSVENGIFYAKDEINITEEYIADLNAAYDAKN